MAEEILDTTLFPREGIRPNTQRAKIAQMLVWAVMILDIVGIVSSYLQLNLLQKIQNGANPPESVLYSNDFREQIIALLYLTVFVISAVTFIQWFRRAYYNLSIRTKCNHAEGWAAGGWFVPIMSLFRPYQIMKEMWTKTTKLISPDSHNAGQDGNALIGGWWALWIIGGFVGNYVMRSSFSGETVDAFIDSTIGDMILSAIGIPMAIVTVLLIKSYSLREEKLSEIESTSMSMKEVDV
jgi:Domain of unknown function (DUF4328)